MSQNELAIPVGISQATLHNIESGNPQKIDFSLLYKICNIFGKDFSYFTTDNTVINNNIRENNGQVGMFENFTINNHYPENILEMILENQDKITNLMEMQNKLIESVLKK